MQDTNTKTGKQIIGPAADPNSKERTQTEATEEQRVCICMNANKECKQRMRKQMQTNMQANMHTKSANKKCKRRMQNMQTRDAHEDASEECKQ